MDTSPLVFRMAASVRTAEGRAVYFGTYLKGTQPADDRVDLHPFLENARDPLLLADGTLLYYRDDVLYRQGPGGEVEATKKVPPLEETAASKERLAGIRSYSDGSRSIVQVDLQSGDEQVLTSGHQDGHPQYSPDGISMIFDRRDAGRSGVYRLDLKTRREKRLTKRQDDAPAFSPDGRHIVFVRTDEKTGRDHIARMREDGSMARTLTENNGYYSNPRYLPDGSRIVFCSESSDGRSRELEVMEDGPGDSHGLDFRADSAVFC